MFFGFIGSIFVMYTIGLIMLLLTALVVLLFLWKSQAQLKAELIKLKRANQEKEQNYATIYADQLKYKLNPHLFKNALNAIQSHAYQSYYALDKLSEVLDYILYDTDGRMMTVKEEVDFARNFIEINRLKTSPLFDIRVKNKISEDDRRYHLPLMAPLTFINPIENAFKHADLQSDNAFISITFSFENDQWLVLQVANKLNERVSDANQKGGLGNEIYLNRLSTIYGRENFLCRESVHQDVFITELKVKLL